MIISMTTKEFSRLSVVQDFASGHISATHAAQVLGVTYRQVFRLRAKLQSHGVTALASGLRGKPSNRKLPEALRRNALDIIKEKYADFGPTLAAEKLQQVERLSVSKETLRQWMASDGLWLSRKARRGAVHQPRYRRECYGELVQIDGSQHNWFENRGPKCTLLVYIDDATSNLMELKFSNLNQLFRLFFLQ